MRKIDYKYKSMDIFLGFGWLLLAAGNLSLSDTFTSNLYLAIAQIVLSVLFFLRASGRLSYIVLDEKSITRCNARIFVTRIEIADIKEMRIDEAFFGTKGVLKISTYDKTYRIYDNYETRIGYIKQLIEEIASKEGVFNE